MKVTVESLTDELIDVEVALSTGSDWRARRIRDLGQIAAGRVPLSTRDAVTSARIALANAINARSKGGE